MFPLFTSTEPAKGNLPTPKGVPMPASYKRPVDAIILSKSDVKDNIIPVKDAPEILVKDEGRKPDLPTCPIILLAGKGNNYIVNWRFFYTSFSQPRPSQSGLH